jgi:hypothetical protein
MGKKFWLLVVVLIAFIIGGIMAYVLKIENDVIMTLCVVAAIISAFALASMIFCASVAYFLNRFIKRDTVKQSIVAYGFSLNVIEGTVHWLKKSIKDENVWQNPDAKNEGILKKHVMEKVQILESWLSVKEKLDDCCSIDELEKLITKTESKIRLLGHLPE